MPPRKSKPTADMLMIVKKKTAVDPWAALFRDAIVQSERKPAGPNWKRREEIRSALGFGVTKSEKMITQLVDEEKLEVFDGLEYVDGKLRRRVWYRPCANPGKKP